MITFSLSLAWRLKSYFCYFFWKTGFCLDTHEKISSCYIQHCRWKKYQICADSTREASDTWILNMPKKGNDNTIEKDIWTKALKARGSLLLSWLQIPWRLWNFAMTNLIGCISLMIRLNGHFATTPSFSLTLPPCLQLAVSLLSPSQVTSEWHIQPLQSSCLPHQNICKWKVHPYVVIASIPRTLKPSFWSHQGKCLTKSISQGIVSILNGSHCLYPPAKFNTSCSVPYM